MSFRDTTEYFIPSTFFFLCLGFCYISYTQLIAEIDAINFVFLFSMFLLTFTLKVGTHEETSSRDLFQGLVRCRIYTMGQVAGTSPLKGLHAGTCYIEIAKFRATSLKFRET